jgi:hypothetical protein
MSSVYRKSYQLQTKMLENTVFVNENAFFYHRDVHGRIAREDDGIASTPKVATKIKSDSPPLM